MGALTSYRDARAVAEALAHARPDDATRQATLSVLSIKIGDILVARKDLAGALAIAARLAAAEPVNAGWQAALATCHEKVGTGQSSQQAKWLPEAERQLAKLTRQQ